MNRTGIPALVVLLVLAFAVPKASAQFDALLGKANKEYELQAFNLAVESYLKALRNRPNDPEALTKLADSYRHLNQMDKASVAYGRAANQPDFPVDQLLNYGLVLKAMGQYKDAKRVFLEFARTLPEIGNHFAQSCDYALLNQTPNPKYQINLSQVSSKDSDFGVAIREDGIVFSSFRLNINRSTTEFSGKAENHLFISKVNPSGQLDAPTLLRPNQPDANNIGPVTFAANGQALGYARNNFINGTRHIPSSGMRMDLFFARLDAGKNWQGEFPFQFNGTNFSTGFPSFAPDGTSMYFASDRPGGFGGYDIWVTHWNGSSFDPPQNLGSTVNSKGNEISPFFDGGRLFFASDWHAGFGGFDIFESQRIGATWGEPENLLFPVNSPFDDYGYIQDREGRHGFLTSNRTGGYGMEDIYHVFSQEGSTSLQVVNASDGIAVPGASLDFTSCGQGTFQTDSRGQFLMRGNPSPGCLVNVTAPGYMASQVPMSSLSPGIAGGPSIINLIRIGEMVDGKITDYNTRQPLPGVEVVITNIQTGHKMQTVTDNLGSYRAAFQLRGQYNVDLTRTGYQNISRRLEVGQRLDPSLLGTISMRGAAVTTVSQRGNEGAFGLPTSTTPQPTTTPQPSQQPTQSGYAVQVAAMRSPNMDKFQSLSRYGSVYTVNAGNLTKVRVGVFNSRQDADQALGQIRNTGFPKAFVVSENGGDPQSRSSSSGSFGLPSVYEPSSTTTSTYGNVQNSSGRYHIQLAAYRDASNFDPTGLEALGQITQRQSSKGLTVMLISAFNSLNDARSALSKAKRAGFPNAFIVENKGDGSFNKTF